jgi:hypothetical protein
MGRKYNQVGVEERKLSEERLSGKDEVKAVEPAGGVYHHERKPV